MPASARFGGRSFSEAEELWRAKPLLMGSEAPGDGRAANRRDCSPAPSRRNGFLGSELGQLFVLAFICVIVAFMVWLTRDGSNCIPKPYRDPVTGRIIGSAAPREDLEALIGSLSSRAAMGEDWRLSDW